MDRESPGEPLAERLREKLAHDGAAFAAAFVAAHPDRNNLVPFAEFVPDDAAEAAQEYRNRMREINVAMYLEFMPRLPPEAVARHIVWLAGAGEISPSVVALMLS